MKCLPWQTDARRLGRGSNRKENATSVILNHNIAASRLKFETLTRANGQVKVSFPAAANQTYTVEWSDQLSGGPWQKLSDVIARAALFPPFGFTARCCAVRARPAS